MAGLQPAKKRTDAQDFFKRPGGPEENPGFFCAFVFPLSFVFSILLFRFPPYFTLPDPFSLAALFFVICKLGQQIAGKIRTSATVGIALRFAA